MPVVVGEVSIPDDNDLREFKELCTSASGWREVFNRTPNSKTGKGHKTGVSTKKASDSPIKMIKVYAEYTNISAALLYDVLQDDDYRKEWDFMMDNSKTLFSIDAFNDVSYYSIIMPKPIKNREFLTQRTSLRLCLKDSEEYFIMHHSINHKDYAPSKTHVRGTSYLSGYYIRKLGVTSCEYYYLAHSDPKGKLPKWLVNRAATTVSPRMVKQVYSACVGYDKWKEEHNPGWKPWIYLHQKAEMNLEKLNPADTLVAYSESTDSLDDESNLEEPCNLLEEFGGSD